MTIFLISLIISLFNDTTSNTFITKTKFNKFVFFVDSTDETRFTELMNLNKYF